LLDRLTATIRRGGHDPSVLCLEVSEAALAADPEGVSRQLAALNEMGVTLAIDDFGARDATPADLQQMPIHMLKIDRALVARLGETPGDVATVSAAVELGHRLGLCVVAEGVETDEQLAQLRDLGCDGAQGFLFSRPMPEEAVCSLLGTR
jgi:EAL domain-containing protein (putative c-di-GMP-specific phosphodiesterase class I)